MMQTKPGTAAYNAAYQRDNIKRIVVKINHKLEPELLAHIEQQDNVQKYILDLIRADMAKNHHVISGSACMHALTCPDVAGNPYAWQNPCPCSKYAVDELA